MSIRNKIIRLAATFQEGSVERTALLQVLAAPDKALKQVQYKGKVYDLMWFGPTKYGNRAKLRFTNGTNEFWVSVGSIAEADGGRFDPKSTSSQAPSVPLGRSTSSPSRYTPPTRSYSPSRRQEPSSVFYKDRCKGCGKSISDAPHNRAMDGYCGYCAFDEFDL